MNAWTIQIAPAVVLDGELDMATRRSAAALLAPLLDRGGTVILDLTNLDFMDSSGVHMILEAAKGLDGRGCLFLHGVHDPVRRLLDIVGVSSVENIHVMPCEVDPFLIHLEAADEMEGSPRRNHGTGLWSELELEPDTEGVMNDSVRGRQQLHEL
jgi:anti-anti-sigma factor